MNGRFLILVAAILGFMHLWSHAVPVRGQRLAKATMPSFAKTPAPSPTGQPTVKKSPVSSVIANAGTQPVARSAVNSSSLLNVSVAQPKLAHTDLATQRMPFQIPSGLAAGDYRVVSSGGYVGTIHVAGGANDAGSAIDCPLVQTRQMGETVCFVRLSENPASTVAAVDAAISTDTSAARLMNVTGPATHSTASEIAAVHVDLAVRVLPSAAATIEPAPVAADATQSTAAEIAATSIAATPIVTAPIAAAEIGIGASIGVCTPVTPKPSAEPVLKSAALDFDKFDGWPVTVPFADSYANQANQSRDSEPTTTDSAQTTDTVNSDFGLEETKWCSAGADIEAAN